MKNKITFLFSFFLCFRGHSLLLQFVPLKMKPGYSVVGIYGRMNDSKSVFVSGDLAQRLSRYLGAKCDFSTQAIVATGVEIDPLFENLSLKKDYPGRSLLIVQPEFRVDFQDLLYDHLDQGLVKEILPQNHLVSKTNAALRALDFAKITGIAFALGKSVELKAEGKERVDEIFYHRSNLFSFFKN